MKNRRGRSFRDEEVEGRRSTLDELLDRDESRLDGLEGKEGSSKVMNSFFETEDKLGWIEFEWTDESIGVVIE